MEIEQGNIEKFLEQLSGTWTGEGTGEYPTIATFRYREALTFTSGEGKPYLHYEQRTWKKEVTGNELPSHWETGFWRILSSNEVELISAQASGRIEVARGPFTLIEDGLTFSVRSSLIANNTRVEQTWREFTLQGGHLQYSLQMQTSAVPTLTLHLQAQLSSGR